MSSPGQRRGSCGHAMANFDSHAFCARCREKGKGSDDCVKNPQSTDCKICNAFSEEQRLQLATPSYRIKKEKREAKKLEATPAKDSEELVDPSNVSVIGPVEKQANSPSEPPPDKKTKKDTKKITKREKSPSATTSKASQSSTDDKIATLDSKLSERFNRLEALLLARNLEPKFSADVKVTPAHSPPSSVAHTSEPFIRPSTSATLPGTGSSAERHQPTSKAMISQQLQQRPSFLVRVALLLSISRPVKLKPADLLLLKAPLLLRISLPVKPRLTDQIFHRILSPTRLPTRALTDLPSPTGLLHPTQQILRHQPYIGLVKTVFQVFHQRPVVICRIDPPLDLYAEEGELSEDPEFSAMDQDQPVSEEQTYQDTMQGIRSYMGWTHIPEVDSSATTAEDNPFAGPKTVTPGKVSVKMPTEEWLCKKLFKLNLSLSEGYPSRGSEAGGLAKDVFLRPPRSQAKWYGLHTDQKTEPSKVSTWHTDAVKLNSSYSKVYGAWLYPSCFPQNFTRNSEKVGKVGQRGIYCMQSEC